MGASGFELSAEEEQALWRLLKATGEPEARLLLIERYLPLARRIATNLHDRRSDRSTEFGDYLHLAVLGLLESVDRFDPAREASFTTYARFRIIGSVRNGVIGLSERTEQAAAWGRAQRARVASLGEGQADDDLDEFAKMADLTVELALGFLLEDSGLARSEESDLGNQPYAGRALQELRARLGAAVAMLPEREQLVVRYHYFFFFGMAEIADLLAITIGRVSQLHRRALTQLRANLEAIGDFDDYY